MNLEEIKRDWNEEKQLDGPQVDWLIAEVERLTAEGNQLLRRTQRAEDMLMEARSKLHLANATEYDRGLRDAAEVAMSNAFAPPTQWGKGAEFNAKKIAAAILAKVGQGEECVWTPINYGMLAPGCGGEDSYRYERAKFCPYCGKPIKVKEG